MAYPRPWRRRAFAFRAARGRSPFLLCFAPVGTRALACRPVARCGTAVRMALACCVMCTLAPALRRSRRPSSSPRSVARQPRPATRLGRFAGITLWARSARVGCDFLLRRACIARRSAAERWAAVLYRVSCLRAPVEPGDVSLPRADSSWVADASIPHAIQKSKISCPVFCAPLWAVLWLGRHGVPDEVRHLRRGGARVSRARGARCGTAGDPRQGWWRPRARGAPLVRSRARRFRVAGCPERHEDDGRGAFCGEAAALRGLGLGGSVVLKGRDVRRWPPLRAAGPAGPDAPRRCAFAS